MKALAIDSAVTKMTIAAKKNEKIITISLDIGMKQSETILPVIDYVLQQLDITPQELDYTVLCLGPGSFTGLRLTFSALKAIELAHAIPVYGFSTLEIYAYPYIQLPFTVIPVIDARHGKFFAAAYHSGKQLLKDGDYTPEEIIKCAGSTEPALICGPDAQMFYTIAYSLNPSLHTIFSQPATTDALFANAENAIAQKKPPLKDFDGPVYLRASEAEEALKG